MGSRIQLATTVLWTAQPLLQWIVAVVLWRRKLHKQFPVFFTYLLLQIAIFAAVYPLQGPANYEVFFWVYWLTAALSAVLGFKIIHEVFLDVFRPYHTLKDLGTVIFKWAGVVMLMVSVVVAFSNSSPSSDPLVNAVLTLQRSVRLVQCGLVLFLLLFSRFLGVSRKQQSFGLALGFGVYASVELMLLVAASGGLLHKPIVNLLNTAAYNAAILIWLGYALAHVKLRETANHLQTQRWEQSLAGLHAAEPTTGVPSHSLIPMFEGMVERAISRTSSLDELDLEIPSPPRVSEPQSPPAAAAAAGSKGKG
jgi:hypothetical protein